ncbi:hypothetical protein A4X06_0g5859, partial [Tilletia controversa]
GNSNGNSKRLLCYGCGARDHERPDCPVASHLLPGNGPICWTCHKQGHVKSECPKSTSSSGKAAAALESYPDADEMLAAMFEPSVLAASTTSTLIPFMIDSVALHSSVPRSSARLLLLRVPTLVGASTDPESILHVIYEGNTALFEGPYKTTTYDKFLLLAWPRKMFTANANATDAEAFEDLAKLYTHAFFRAAPRQSPADILAALGHAAGASSTSRAAAGPSADEPASKRLRM